jgi:hypothetical protein
VNKDAPLLYANHPLQKRIYVLLFILFASAGGFLMATLYVGQIGAKEILSEKPDVMGWSEYRRTLTLSIKHWQREIYLESRDHPSQMSSLITEFQVHSCALEEWQDAADDLYYKHKQLLGSSILVG